MVERVLVVAAHPDDEILGCGGTIAAFAQKGAKVTIALLADGMTARHPSNDEELQSKRSAARIASDIVGADPPLFGDFPDNQLDTLLRLRVPSTDAAKAFILGGRLS